MAAELGTRHIFSTRHCCMLCSRQVNAVVFLLFIRVVAVLRHTHTSSFFQHRKLETQWGGDYEGAPLSQNPPSAEIICLSLIFVKSSLVIPYDPWVHLRVLYLGAPRVHRSLNYRLPRVTLENLGWTLDAPRLGNSKDSRRWTPEFKSVGIFAISLFLTKIM